MKWSAIQSRWDEYKVAAKRRWGKLSEQQLHGTRGQREYLLKRVQEAYSLSADAAEREVADWEAQTLAGGRPRAAAPGAAAAGAPARAPGGRRGGAPRRGAPPPPPPPPMSKRPAFYLI